MKSKMSGPTESRCWRLQRRKKLVRMVRRLRIKWRQTGVIGRATARNFGNNVQKRMDKATAKYKE